MSCSIAGSVIHHVHIKNQFSTGATERLAILSIETCHFINNMIGSGMHNIDYHLVKFPVHLFENSYPESFDLVLVAHAPLLFSNYSNFSNHWFEIYVESEIHFLKCETDVKKIY
jgi:hypothetical protein